RDLVRSTRSAPPPGAGQQGSGPRSSPPISRDDARRARRLPARPGSAARSRPVAPARRSTAPALDRPRGAPGLSRRRGRPAFGLAASKLRRPPLRPGMVRRSPLIERLARGEPRPIVSVAAPAGYGKTTLLSQWAERNAECFAWVSADEGDNDPKVLPTYIA